MAQITSGIRAILSQPVVYSAFQRFMGAYDDRERYVREFLRPVAGMRVLDIGCGPADILAHLPDVEYHGFDISEQYIETARRRFGDRRARFACKHLCPDDLDTLPRFDRVIAIGLLHHLDDETARGVLRMASSRLAEGGRLVTLDPCLTADQNPVARWLVKSDRGRNVRTLEGYEGLARAAFDRVHATVRHKRWIPYTHCHVVCENDGTRPRPSVSESTDIL
ncbi:class I SAM-dependent methyltransferase [Trinickia sp. NRRL B-1857]|uniref:class I SAM-dependent methyltransferase n=1 Tax=Trinickia sp. NRRL B-1857 TaxID=3162879 RepID=UPI003D29BC36